MKIAGEKDLHTILQELTDVAHKWSKIGLALGLKPCDLEKIQRNQQDDRLYNVILQWLKMNYDTKTHGPPTWTKIVKAVGANPGGENTALANELARKYVSKYSLL